MNDEWLRDAYERGLPPAEPAPDLDDVAAERLRRLVEGDSTDEERLRTLDATLATAEGRRNLDIVWAASRAAKPRRTAWYRYAAAASLVIMAGASTLWWRDRDIARSQALRGAESPVTLVAPVGEVGIDRSARFVWRAVRDVERYTLVVIDTSGTELFAIETRDTTSTLPDSVRLVPGHAYLWWVQARRADQSTVTAVTQRVRVTSP